MMISLQAINLHRILSVVAILFGYTIYCACIWVATLNSLLFFMNNQTIFFEDYHELVRNVCPESGLELGDVELRICPRDQHMQWMIRSELRFKI